MEQARSRSNLYALLSRILLQELDVEFIDRLKNDAAMLEFFPSLKEWDLLNELDSATLLNEHINVDFVNISLLHLTPYEGFYIRDDQMIETGGANPVTDYYSAYNFVVDFEKARVVAPDHIAIELEFMHTLVEAQIKATEAGDYNIDDIISLQKEFLNKHLLQWVPMYLISVKYEARTPLYHDAADMAIEFLLSDNEYLSQVAKAV